MFVHGVPVNTVLAGDMALTSWLVQVLVGHTVYSPPGTHYNILLTRGGGRKGVGALTLRSCVGMGGCGEAHHGASDAGDAQIQLFSVCGQDKVGHVESAQRVFHDTQLLPLQRSFFLRRPTVFESFMYYFAVVMNGFFPVVSLRLLCRCPLSPEDRSTTLRDDYEHPHEGDHGRAGLGVQAGYTWVKLKV